MVTACNSVGKFGDAEIYRLVNISMVSMRGNQADEEKVIEIKKLLCNGTFYFSWSAQGQGQGQGHKALDLTLCAQKTVKTNTETDNRFFW